MPTENEKLSILSEMIEFAKVDNEIRRMEYEFLLLLAQKLNIAKETFDHLFKVPAEHVLPKSQTERIIQFHRLALLMNVDHHQDISEIKKLHDIGLKIGLPPGAMQQVLMIMHQYPDKIVPPEVLISIFKSHYN
ncbi:TerB family tellurite resistance protein [Maribacter sp. LLG6340-A2]|uniref:TerB family tellurite resistance protein n=1 Tax=Maribacter sp. LLG6340-A2 TaxID=3160834 RepID=UPI00387038D7